MTVTLHLGNLRLVKSLQRFLPNQISKEVLLDLCLLFLQVVSAMHRCPITSRRFRFEARVGLELLVVHGSLRMKYGVGQLNSFSRPRDVLPDKFTYMWTRTTRRSPPLYALTLEILCEGQGYRPTPIRGKPSAYTPALPFCHAPFANLGTKFHFAGWLGTCLVKVPALNPLRWNFSTNAKSPAPDGVGLFELRTT